MKYSIPKFAYTHCTDSQERIAIKFKFGSSCPLTISRDANYHLLVVVRVRYLIHSGFHQNTKCFGVKDFNLPNDQR